MLTVSSATPLQLLWPRCFYQTPSWRALKAEVVECPELGAMAHSSPFPISFQSFILLAVSEPTLPYSPLFETTFSPLGSPHHSVHQVVSPRESSIFRGAGQNHSHRAGLSSWWQLIELSFSSSQQEKIWYWLRASWSPYQPQLNLASLSLPSWSLCQ